jgi:hypothetical protein
MAAVLDEAAVADTPYNTGGVVSMVIEAARYPEGFPALSRA